MINWFQLLSMANKLKNEIELMLEDKEITLGEAFELTRNILMASELDSSVIITKDVLKSDKEITLGELLNVIEMLINTTGFNNSVIITKEALEEAKEKLTW